jgi:hypothetical protein
MKKYNKIVTQINELSTEQKFLKNQRKTVYINGERKMEPWEATYKHQINRDTLRHLYQAYAIVRGVERPESQVDINESKVEKMVEEYKLQ